MILDRLSFKYHDKVIIEKVIATPPYRMEALFQDQGCFLYFKDAGFDFLSDEGTAPIESNEAVLLRCGSYFLDFMKEIEKDKIEIIAVHLYPDILKKLYIKELPEVIERRTQDKGKNIVAPQDIITKFIESLEFYFKNPSLVSDDLLELKIKELILLLLQSKNIDSILELVNDLYSPKAVSIKNVVDLHLFTDLSIDELAKMCNLSLSSFKREFKKEFNDSPKNYILEQRLHKAKELLAITDMPVNEIAYETGFNDPHYFSRLFKKKKDKTPGEYRTALIQK